MSVQVYGVNIVTGVAHFDAISAALFQMMGRCCHHLGVWISYAVYGPTIEAGIGSIAFLEQHLEGLIGCGCRTCFGKS